MIHSVTGVWPQFFRPPFGDYGPATGPSANGQTNTQNTTTLLNTVTSDLTAKYGAPAGYSMALTAWSVDSTDSASPAPTLAAIVAAAATVQNGGVLLMHDDNQNTVDSIPRLSTLWRRRACSRASSRRPRCRNSVRGIRYRPIT